MELERVKERKKVGAMTGEESCTDEVRGMNGFALHDFVWSRLEYKSPTGRRRLELEEVSKSSAATPVPRALSGSCF